MVFLYLAVVLVGIANAVQPGMTNGLGKALGLPLLAGLVSALTGLVVFVTLGLITGQITLPGQDKLAATPWWAWFGGLLGALLVLSQLYLAHRVGAGRFIGISVTAAIVTSILLDHFGLFGFEQHPAGLGRLVGGALMIAGVLLVAAF